MSSEIYNKLERAPREDPKYLAWIRTFPCIVCFQTRNIEACHTPGERGLSQKADDRRAVAMCRHHHRQQTRMGWKNFIQFHQLDLEFWIDLLSARPHLTRIGESWYAEFTQKDPALDCALRIGSSREYPSLSVVKDLRYSWLVEMVFRDSRSQSANGGKSQPAKDTREERQPQ